MKSLLKMTWMEAKLLMREPIGVFLTLVLPLLYLFLFGIISGNAPAPEPEPGHPWTIDSAIPALTAMIIATSGLLIVTITIATYRENGVLRRLRTTPVSPLMVLGAQVIVTFAMTCLGMLLLIAAGTLVFHIKFEGNAFSVLGGFVLSSLSLFGIGFVLAGIMPTARTANIVGLALLYPMLFLSGAFFPLGTLPAAVQKFSAFLPLTYVVNLLNGLWVGETWGSHLLDVGVLTGMLILGIIISTKTFRWE